MHPESAGSSILTVLVDDLDERLTGIAARGVGPAKRETYDNGVRKIWTATLMATRSASAERPTRRCSK